MSHLESPLEFSAEDEYLFQTTRTELLKPAPSATGGWGKFLISFVLFLLLFGLLFTPLELAWLTGTLFFHEAGHFLGMRYFGYRDVQMFFIPGLGAAVSGVKKKVPAWQEAIVLLLGPLPGLLLGCSLYFLDQEFSLPDLREGAAWLVTINFLNLMPVGPLDGSRLFNRLLFSRSAFLEAVFVVPALVGLVFMCLDPGLICLGLTGLVALITAPIVYKSAAVAQLLQARWPDLPQELEDLSDEQLRVLFKETRQRFGDVGLAARMNRIHHRALRHPASASVTVGFLALYAAAIALTVVTVSQTQLGEDAGRWPTQFRKKLSETVEPDAPAEK